MGLVVEVLMNSEPVVQVAGLVLPLGMVAPPAEGFQVFTSVQ
jgi:hypothetical protein